MVNVIIGYVRKLGLKALRDKWHAQDERAKRALIKELELGQCNVQENIQPILELISTKEPGERVYVNDEIITVLLGLEDFINRHIALWPSGVSEYEDGFVGNYRGIHIFRIPQPRAAENSPGYTVVMQ